MTILLTTTMLRELVVDIERMHQEMFPNEPESNGGFYLIKPHLLYVDEAIDNETAGELDKLICRYIGTHKVLEKWADANRKYTSEGDSL